MPLLSTHLSELIAAKRKALVTYLVAGDPAPGITVPLMHRLVESGADVIELGMPFSDPEAEGPVIQLAHERALAHNTSLNDCLDMVGEFRQQNQTTPVVLMGYLNPIETLGYAAFAERASSAGVNGTIIVNLPPEEAGDLSKELAANDIEMVYLLSPTTTDERAKHICEASRGFVYYVSLKGTTGAATLDVRDVAEKLAGFRRFSKPPIMVGFGIKKGADAKAVAAVADGAVVGTVIVDLMAQHKSDAEGLIKAVGELVREMRQAID